MKKYLAVALVAVMLAITAPAHAVVNPFMDVPMHHWAYDAVGYLASRGIVEGFPDGTYRGAQPITRFEMATLIARAVQDMDRNSVSRRDFDMLTRLVVEFKDELDALGVRVDELFGQVDGLHRRLGGWQISGALRLDIEDIDNNDTDAHANLAWGRLFLDRWFGANEDMRFHARLRNDGREGGTAGEGVRLQRFWVEFPFFFENTRMTVGRFSFQFENNYAFMTGGISDWGLRPWFGDRDNDGFMTVSRFGFGNFTLLASRRAASGAMGTAAPATEPWEAAAWFNLQPTEAIALDIGVHALMGDDATTFGGVNDESVTTFFGGLRWNFNRNITLGGMFYGQSSSGSLENGNALRAFLSVDQEMFGFTSLWLGFDMMDADFRVIQGASADGFIASYTASDAALDNRGFRFEVYDATAFRVGATQQWNPRWRTWLYFGLHNFEHTVTGDDFDVTQWGVGVEYRLNPNVAFALNFINMDWDDNFAGGQDNHLIRLRTQINF